MESVAKAFGPAVGLLFGVTLLLAGFCVGRDAGRGIERGEAVKAGVARWEADPQTGEARFVYGVKAGGAR